MKIEILEKNDINLRIVVKDADTPLMNALRRLALAEVPCMAIEEVVMIENSSISTRRNHRPPTRTHTTKNQLRHLQPSRSMRMPKRIRLPKLPSHLNLRCRSKRRNQNRVQRRNRSPKTQKFFQYQTKSQSSNWQKTRN